MSRITRWIYFPLVTAAICVLVNVITARIQTGRDLMMVAGYGWAMGAIILGFKNYISRNRSKGSTPWVFDVRQNRTLTVMRGIDEALELCREAVLSLGNAELTSVDPNTATVVTRTRSSWRSLGSEATIQLTRISDRLTEINISTRPTRGTALTDSGESWDIVERLLAYLRRYDKDIDPKVLADGASILHDAAVKPRTGNAPPART